METVLTYTPNTPNARTVNTLAALVCVTGVATVFANHGVAAFGMATTHFAGQSAILHTLRALQYEAWPAVRFAVSGFGLGICAFLYAWLRASFPDAYLEHVGGNHARNSALQIVLCHVAAPVLAVLHVLGAPTPVPITALALVAFVDVSAVTLLHEATVVETDRHLASTEALIIFYLVSLCASFGMALALEATSVLWQRVAARV